MVRGTFNKYPNKHALDLLNESASHGHAALVQIDSHDHELEETRA
jgi:hypothetical protein